MQFILSAEAACDLNRDMAEKYSVSVMSMKYYVNGKEYETKDKDYNVEGIYEQMTKGVKTSTTKPNDFEVEEYLRSLLKKGKDVLHLSFSSAMSGTCATVKEVAEKLNREGENRIYVVDTLCQSSGVALLLAEISKKAEEENWTVKQAFNYAERIKLYVSHYFAVDTLTYLARGGRVAPSLAIFGNLVNIKPILNVSTEGKIYLVQKVFGKKRALKTLAEKFNSKYVPVSKTVFIGYAGNLKEAEELKSELLKMNPDLDIILNPLGPVIACHSGPGTVALFFTSEERLAK